MIINEIELTNIGAYRGNNTFDFRTADKKNVILIGGENGAGKTTLLNAIKLGLFGSYGYGFKTDSAEYYKKVKGLLNHDAKKIEENNFKIKIQFSLIDNLEKTDYILFRHWALTNQSIKEKYELIANGKHLNEYDVELFQSKLREVMPPQLLDLCLFDGEEIARIVSEDLLSIYLKKLSRVVFNLDLFETLETDLENYSNQTFDAKKVDSYEKELYDLNQREKNLKNQIVSLISQQKEQNEKKIYLQDEYQKIKSDFEKYGGLVKTERDEIIKEMNDIESVRKHNLEKIREFVANLLPFYLSKKLLNDTRKQIKDEESLQLYKQLDMKLSDEKLVNITKTLTNNYDSSIIHELKIQLLNLVKPESEINQIHGSSFSESSLIENMFLNVNSNISEEYLDILTQNRTRLSEIQVLREKLKVNDSTNEFSEMIQNMESIQQTLVKLDDEIDKTTKELAELKNTLESTTSEIDKIQRNLNDNEKTVSSFLESQKIIALSRRFREVQLKKKLQQVQIEATNMLKKILRKHNYITFVQIDPESFDVQLLDSQKEQIEKSTLSAGEKEILLISIIWAIFKCSKRKVPFIFDTLLGRLDKTHKAAVLKEFIPSCSKQAIILSTDTEIDEEHYRILESHLAKEYMLEFNVERKETKIINEYFSFQQMELSI